MASIESIEYSRQFLKKFSRLPKKIIDGAQKKERLFKIEPYHSSLRTHQLHGKESDSWAFWIDYKYRVKFIFVNQDRVLFLDVDLHDIYG